MFIPSNSTAYGATRHARIYTDPSLTEYYFGYPHVKNMLLWELR